MLRHRFTALALTAGLAVLAEPSPALAAESCTSYVAPPAASGALGPVVTYASGSCTIAMTSISVSVQLFYFDPAVGNYVLIGSGHHAVTGSAYGEATASGPCVPGLYYADADISYVSPPGWVPATFSRHVDSPEVVLACV